MKIQVRPALAVGSLQHWIIICGHGTTQARPFLSLPTASGRRPGTHSLHPRALREALFIIPRVSSTERGVGPILRRAWGASGWAGPQVMRSPIRRGAPLHGDGREVCFPGQFWELSIAQASAPVWGLAFWLAVPATFHALRRSNPG